MGAQILALSIFVALFLVGGWRRVHMGVVAIAGAGLVGMLVAGLSPEEIIGGFPVDLMLLLAGVTLLFGVAQANGTIDVLINQVLENFSNRRHLLPFVVFALGLVVAAMAATGALAVIPVTMQIARHHKIDPMLISVSMGTGLTVGMFAPIGLFGIITYGTAEAAGIHLNPLILFLAAAVINLILLGVGIVIYGGLGLFRERKRSFSGATAVGWNTTEEFGDANSDVGDSPSTQRQRIIQWVTMLMILLFILSIIVMELAGLSPDIGLLAFVAAGLLLLFDPQVGKKAMSHIQWNTILLVGGIITYVGVLQSMGAVELLGDSAARIGSPLAAAFVLFFIGGLVSAFASTTGTLAAIVPLAIPLTETGGFAPWAAIVGLALCSALADVAPFSTVGATMASTAPDWEGSRRSFHARLFTWGMAMVVVGPVLVTSLVLLPSYA